VACALLEFLVPYLLKNGQTVGKKMFSLGVMRVDGVKISTFSLESAGMFDLDAELEIYLSGVGCVKFEFTGSTDVKEICKTISTYALK
jgi:hypothetical protein